jgi:hypothetical protein
VTRELGSRWKAGLTGEYLFLHQVFDVSATEAELSTVLARGHTLTLTPSGGLDLGRGWGVRADTDGTRQLFTAPLDNYWELKPSVAFTKTCTDRLDVTLAYTFGGRWYDTRSPLDAEGDPLPGRLEFAAHEVELRSKVFWGAARQWRAQLRLGWLENRDNGDGYFDFTRLAPGLQLQYASGPWTLRLDGRLRWYDYPVQRTDGPGSSLRERTDFSGLARAEFKISRKLRLFAQYERDSSDDKAPDTSYDANGLTAGVEFEL